MKAVVEPLEGNRVKLSVEVEEQEFEAAVDAAFRRIARQVRIPGFRPGKAPRRLLEARLGADTVREEALRESLPEYYARAVQENEVDAIAPPEIDITGGREAGPVQFDAVVEVRPQVSVPGYAGLRVTVPSPRVTDEDLQRQIDRLRRQSGQLQVVSRPARDGDQVTIDTRLYRHDETLHEATDELYEVGSASLVPGLDDNLRGATVGDILKFNAGSGDDEVSVQVLVKEVKEVVLPEPTDEWAGEASEFDTLEELQADIRKRMQMVKKVQSRITLHEEAVKALVELVDTDVPEPLVQSELADRVNDLVTRLRGQGATIDDYLEATGQSREELVGSLREGALGAVKADLSLRAVADAEGLEPAEHEVEERVQKLATELGRPPDDVRHQLEHGNHMAAVRSDIRKAKALDWLLEHLEVVDEEGRPVDRADLATGDDSGEEEELTPMGTSRVEKAETAESAT